jgi:hypothetical protein
LKRAASDKTSAGRFFVAIRSMNGKGTRTTAKDAGAELPEVPV